MNSRSMTTNGSAVLTVACFRCDKVRAALVGTLVMASLLPCRGAAAVTVDPLTNAAIALVFFCMAPSCHAKR